MRREIKFRCFDGTRMLYSENGDFYVTTKGAQVPSSTGHEYYNKDYPVMQYTGILDIYEGDTAAKTFTEKVGKHSVERTVTGEVIWSTQKAGFVLLVKEYVDDNVFSQRHYELDGCIATGNIYQTPTHSKAD